MAHPFSEIKEVKELESAVEWRAGKTLMGQCSRTNHHITAHQVLWTKASKTLYKEPDAEGRVK